jgi:hypothetical protein
MIPHTSDVATKAHFPHLTLAICLAFTAFFHKFYEQDRDRHDGLMSWDEEIRS